MINVKGHKTYDMFSPFEHLGPKRLTMLESSWAHLFREEILHRLPAEKLSNVIRPNKEVPLDTYKNLSYTDRTKSNGLTTCL